MAPCRVQRGRCPLVHASGVSGVHRHHRADGLSLSFRRKMAGIDICWLGLRSSGLCLVRTCRRANVLACFRAVAWSTCRSKSVALAFVRANQSHHKCALCRGDRTGFLALGALVILATAGMVASLASARQAIAPLGIHMRPNHAFNRTRRYGCRLSRLVVAAGRLTWSC